MNTPLRAIPSCCLALMLLGTASTSLAQTSAANGGERGFRQYCKACHSLTPGKGSRLGPALNGVPGQKAGTTPGYAYSDALKTSGIVWSEAEFMSYLRAPAKRIPGTKKLLPGVNNEQALQAIYRYLATLPRTGGR
ncbi:MAG: hypothetical protein CGU29_03390 [Candidatus Dactylopiibacterium carminicum]|uniref:Cytochrome c domain-containing protein n=1 Tax=Candidatus Dactylopiibacterium carminicum TaxID=857335 RepID=A0A272EWV2_9RHOO|nr:c-type cytochrome [Candidatus Dactylopiibacterium carminicum]KAF7600025.1 hypothetical protein BGI27_04605 [Candidatus Dactylopiibacterium carminicum]PAS94585.1 MAG: hypothetical protein CGU29_03390 [Candidatus Dactylopiibacterium carminicum]